MPSQPLAPDQVAELNSMIRRTRAGALVLQCRHRELGLDAEADEELAHAEWLEELGEQLGQCGRRIIATR